MTEVTLQLTEDERWAAWRAVSAFRSMIGHARGIPLADGTPLTDEDTTLIHLLRKLGSAVGAPEKNQPI